MEHRIAVFGAALFAAAPAIAAEPHHFHFDYVLGTSLDFVAMASDEAAASMAVQAGLAEIARLDAVFSAYREDSELSALNRAASPHAASPEMFALLRACESWRTETGGAFDCRVGALAALQKEGASPQTIADALAALQSVSSHLNPATRTVERPAGAIYALDGVAKGAIIDAALAAARRATPGQVSGLMIDLGGDVRCWGEAPHADGWRIGIGDPARPADNAAPAGVLFLRDRAVATSGRAPNAACAGRAPLLSPITGLPTDEIARATVVANSAVEADALSTAFSVMRPAESLACAAARPGVEALIIDRKGQSHATPGWMQLAQGTKPAAAASKSYWPGGFGFSVAYQVPKIEAATYHAPYVAIWVTDMDRKLVRTLLLLGQKARWVQENYVWWRRYGRNDPSVVDSMSKPTRAPGKYEAQWDGADDAGKPVAPGRYLLHMEASREKGGHTYEMIELDLSGAPTQAAQPAKDELGPVSVTFGPA